jgi:hypothetical protein
MPATERVMPVSQIQPPPALVFNRIQPPHPFVLNRDALVCGAFALVAVVLIGLVLFLDGRGGRRGTGWIATGIAGGEPSIEQLAFAP